MYKKISVCLGAISMLSLSIIYKPKDKYSIAFMTSKTVFNDDINIF